MHELNASLGVRNLSRAFTDGKRTRAQIMPGREDDSVPEAGEEESAEADYANVYFEGADVTGLERVCLE